MVCDIPMGAAYMHVHHSPHPVRITSLYRGIVLLLMLYPLMLEVLGMFKKTLEFKTHCLNIHANHLDFPMYLFQVIGDVLRIRQILTNLVRYLWNTPSLVHTSISLSVSTFLLLKFSSSSTKSCPAQLLI